VPEYDYKCRCGRRFTRCVPVAERDEQDCECGLRASKLITTQVALHWPVRLTDRFSGPKTWEELERTRGWNTPTK